MENLRYKAVCLICGYYSIKTKPENAISDLQHGNGLQSAYLTVKCPIGKHNIQLFEIKDK